MLAGRMVYEVRIHVVMCKFANVYYYVLTKQLKCERMFIGIYG